MLAPRDADNLVIDLIANSLGTPILRNAKKRIGEFLFERSHAKWHQLSVRQRLCMTAADRSRANRMNGSSFHSSPFAFQAFKQNAGS